MSEERMRILNMVAEGKITPDDAAKLLDALGSGGPTPAAPRAPGKRPRFLRVHITGGEKEKVNVRVPIQLIRSGINLGAMLEGETAVKVGSALKEKGIPLDLSRLKASEIDALVGSLADLSVDIEDGDERVRVFCECE